MSKGKKRNRDKTKRRKERRQSSQKKERCPLPLEIICQNCQAKLQQTQRSLFCPFCSASAVEYCYRVLEDRQVKILENEKGIWRFQEFLPVFEKRISLGEGNTPIRKARQILKNKIVLYFKVEGANPTGSFLDRVSPLMVSDALSQGMKALVCASDGNLGASLSAYSAAAQLKCYCVVPKNTSPEKRTQIQAFGAEIINFGETIDDSLSLAKKLIEKGRYQATPEYNILTIEGTKTIAFEIIEQFTTKKSHPHEPFPDFIVIPMGSGGLLYSIWRGLKQAQKAALLPNKAKLPRIIGVQVEGFDSIVKAFHTGKTSVDRSTKKTKKTVADALSVRQPTYGEKAMQSILESKGIAITATEEEIINASKSLAEKEGLFVELSSAIVVAAVKKLAKEQFFKKSDVVLTILTASGLKTSRAFQRKTAPAKRIRAFRSMGTKLEILTILDQQNDINFGYSIWKELGQNISLQAVYQHLKELVQKEFIKEEEMTDRQKKYRLTEKGRLLIQKMKELEELLE